MVLVLWVLVLLTVIAGSFVYSVHGQTSLAASAVDRARAQALADGGVARAAYALLQQNSINPAGGWAPDGQTHRFELAGATVEVTLTSETGFIDINLAPLPLLQSLLQSVGVSVDRADAIAQAIVAWRQPVSAAGLGTASAQGGVSAHGRFQSIEALQAVPGITPEIFARLAPLITVYSGQPTVNTAIAPVGVLRALPGVTAEQIATYVELRRSAWAARQPVPPFSLAGSYGGGQISPYVGVRAVARLPSGATYVRQAVIQVMPSPDRPVNYLSWRSGSTDDPE